MKGANPIRPPVKGDGSVLDVVRIFPTLQGEGPNTGVPAVFLRLGGCNLACDFCDTEFEQFHPMSRAAILDTIRQASLNEKGMRSRHLVVITGGEPLRQPIEALCEALLVEGFTVQIETNGTLMRPLPQSIQIVCSPKNTGQGYFPLRPDVLARAQALKFLISASHPLYGEVPDIGQSQHATPVYVQPMDEYDAQKNQANLALAQQMAATYGYRLSLQTHKILGIE